MTFGQVLTITCNWINNLHVVIPNCQNIKRGNLFECKIAFVCEMWSITVAELIRHINVDYCFYYFLYKYWKTYCCHWILMQLKFLTAYCLKHALINWLLFLNVLVILMKHKKSAQCLPSRFCFFCVMISRKTAENFERDCQQTV